MEFGLVAVFIDQVATSYIQKDDLRHMKNNNKSTM